jgi:hypothetical protein
MKRFVKSMHEADGLRGRGSLRLVVSGFAEDEPVGVGDVLRTLDALPQFHLAGLNEIVYAPVPDVSYPSLGFRFPDRTVAEFDQQARAIFVYRLPELALFRHVLYHEVGHFVFFLVISSKVKKTWVTEIFPQSVSTTDYGAESAAEDFAETYALYARDAELLQEFPRKRAFMREQVFSGRVVTLKAAERAAADAED